MKFCNKLNEASSLSHEILLGPGNSKPKLKTMTEKRLEIDDLW